MNMNVRYIVFGIILATTTGIIRAQDTETKYTRSSMYSMLVNHTDQLFADEIRTAFLQIPVPDKFNNHDLSIKVLDLSGKLEGANKDKENDEITKFLSKNHIASRLVGKWFDRDMLTGQCDMELVKERGLYNASEFDKQLSKRSARGIAMLQDAGGQLIGNTFVIVNDIRYIDRNKGAKVVGSIFKVLGSIAAAYTGNNDFNKMGDNLSDISETFKGFKVKINTFLYKLDWNDDIAKTFYTEQYSAKTDSVKRDNFENARGNYSLKYIGKVESSGGTTSFLGIKETEPILMVRKACQRAIDENVVDLQRDFVEFRTKSPLVSVDPLTAYIGMKEGVNAKSKFEVLEMVELENGMRKYNRVGVVEPIENLIWDNRFMASEEGAPGADLGFTTFRTVSGKDFAKGMLLREMSEK